MKGAIFLTVFLSIFVGVVLCQNDGRPGCMTRYEFKRFWRNRLDNSVFFNCTVWGESRVIACPPGTLFQEAWQTCVPANRFQETPFYDPPTSAYTSDETMCKEIIFPPQCKPDENNPPTSTPHPTDTTDETTESSTESSSSNSEETTTSEWSTVPSSTTTEDITTVEPTTAPETSTTEEIVTTEGPTNPPETTLGPTNPPETTEGLTDAPTTTEAQTNPPETTAGPTNPPETTAGPTNPPETTEGLTDAPTTTAGPTNPPETTAGPTNPPETTEGLTDAPTTTDSPTNPPENTTTEEVKTTEPTSPAPTTTPNPPSIIQLCPGAAPSSGAPGSHSCSQPLCTEEEWRNNEHLPSRQPSIFYQCVAPGVPVQKECPGGTCFSTQFKVCVHPYQWMNPCDGVLPA
uniref:Putative mucin-2-like bombus impatiens n=1 Tax=Lutzomyia longipalpis TaxID=7200 RepID=A0A7G3ATC8_LUTLO